MNDIRLDFNGLDGLLDMLERYPEVTREVLADVTREATLLVERNVKARTPVGVGGSAGLKGSIAANEPAWLGNELVGVVGTPLAHARPVELGTKPHFPPVEPLEDWVRAKLDVEEDEVRNVAFLVARKIAARGTEGQHMFRDGVEASRQAVDRMFADVPRRVIARVSA